MIKKLAISLMFVMPMVAIAAPGNVQTIKMDTPVIWAEDAIEEAIKKTFPNDDDAYYAMSRQFFTLDQAKGGRVTLNDITTVLYDGFRRDYYSSGESGKRYNMKVALPCKTLLIDTCVKIEQDFFAKEIAMQNLPYFHRNLINAQLAYTNAGKDIEVKKWIAEIGEIKHAQDFVNNQPEFSANAICEYLVNEATGGWGYKNPIYSRTNWNCTNYDKTVGCTADYTCKFTGEINGDQWTITKTIMMRPTWDFLSADVCAKDGGDDFYCRHIEDLIYYEGNEYRLNLKPILNVSYRYGNQGQHIPGKMP